MITSNPTRVRTLKGPESQGESFLFLQNPIDDCQYGWRHKYTISLTSKDLFRMTLVSLLLHIVLSFL